MRLTAILPVLCCTVALILSFLCLFAGHKKGFMQDYHMLTLNTSRLGEGVVDNLISDVSTPSFLEDVIPDSVQDLGERIGDKVGEKVGEVVGATTERIGIDDFYSAHLLNYCSGQYTPGEVPNDTLALSDISMHVTNCSEQSAMFWFNPEDILQRALDRTNLGITLEDLDWPDNIQSGLDALRIASTTAFVLYCLSIAFIFVALVASVPAVFSTGRLTVCLNFMISVLAFLAIGLASGLVTGVIVKGTDIINQYGNDIGVDAHQGGKFLAITWATTVLMFITLVAWSAEVCCSGRRSKNKQYPPPKHG